ncbi:MAG: hypothetical protein CVT88_03300 [Candidatus Altiarchaeales archaeon HGW-Altiarchaeales-1]|nr:MAG: hypothetical protein CVT88_03300 [Candidatus Altiarchaeales archaeon HGW-Altiarchaeales-1]
MRICYIAHACSPHVYRWAEWFTKRGHEVHIISPVLPSEVPDELKDVYLHELNFDNYSSFIKILPFKSIWLTIFSCRKIIKEIKPDIVQGIDITDFGLPALFCGDYPNSVSAWGSDVLIYPKRSMITRLIVKFVAKRAELIHSFAYNLTDELISFGADKERIFTISPTICIENFNIAVNGSKIRKSLGWENNPVVISVRDFAPVYNIECLINAVPTIIKEIPDAKFLIKGIGPLEDKLKNMIKEIGISDSVKIMGHVPYKELPKYLACADVYVSTALSEGLGIANLESIACGIPAVLTDITSDRNLIKAGLNVHLFPVKNSKILAEKIIYLIKNKQREEIKKENFEIIKEHYDFDKNMEKIKKLYEDLIEKHKKMK